MDRGQYSGGMDGVRAELSHDTRILNRRTELFHHHEEDRLGVRCGDVTGEMCTRIDSK